MTEEPVHVAAVARVPPAMLQLMVAPPWVVLDGGIDVPGLEMGKYCVDRKVRNDL
jgi:hypothetical protein